MSSSSKYHFTAVVNSKEHGLYNSSRGNHRFPLTPSSFSNNYN